MKSDFMPARFLVSLALGSALIFTGCSTTPDGSFKGDQTEDVTAVVTTPVNDIGFYDIEIPAYLAEMSDPYAAPPTGCESARVELEKLDGLLGEDLDIPDDLAQEREQMVLNAGSSAIGSVLIPFRGVVRAISGAAKNEREARDAYERGLVRRAYIKGLSKSLNCPA